MLPAVQQQLFHKHIAFRVDLASFLAFTSPSSQRSDQPLHHPSCDRPQRQPHHASFSSTTSPSQQPTTPTTMAFSGFLFLSWRIFELVMTIPIVGMLAWFVHQYVRANQLTPNYILVLFIVSVLALAWIVFTIISYVRARHDALFVALVDLGFVGAFIGGVVTLRFITNVNCGGLNAGVTTSGSYLNWNVNKTCAMLKASFAFGIIDIIAFAVTCVSPSTPSSRLKNIHR